MKDYSNYYSSSKDKLINDGNRLFQMNLQGFDGVDVLVNGKPRKLIVSEKYSVKEYLLKVIDEHGKLNMGDLIYYNDKNWLLRKIDKENPVFDTGTLEYSPSSIKWLDELGEIQEYHFIFNSDNLSNFGIEDGKVISILNDRRNIVIKSSDVSKTIKVNQRFIFDGSAWKVTSINRINPLIEMVLESSSIDPSKDNLELRIADYVKPDYRIILDQSNVSLKIGDSLQLTPKVTNNNIPLENPQLSYVTSDTQVCTVNDTGLLTAVAEGVVTVTISFKDININLAVSIVQEETHSYSVVINGDSTITKSKTKTYTCVFYDNDTIVQLDGTFNITDLNNNPSTLAVITSQSNNSCVVHGDTLGYVLLHASSSDGLITSSKQIQVKSLI